MHAIPWLTDWQYLPGVDIAVGAVMVFVCTWAAGFVIDGVMRDLGFGPFIDGVIALCFAFFGLYFRYHYIVAPAGMENVATGFFVIAAPIAALLAIGLWRARAA
jgi:hypothetical protein